MKQQKEIPTILYYLTPLWGKQNSNMKKAVNSTEKSLPDTTHIFQGCSFFATLDLFILPDTCLSTESFFHLMRISITLTLYISRLHDGLVFSLFLAVLVSVTRIWHLLWSWAHGTCSSQLPWYSKLLTTIVRSELWKLPSRLINSVGRKSIKANPCTDIHREVSNVRLHW